MLYQKVLYLFVQEISRKYLNFWYYRNGLIGHEKDFFEYVRKQAFIFYKKIHKLSEAAERFETWGSMTTIQVSGMSHTEAQYTR